MPLTVSGRSSVLINKESKWGAKLALTPVSNTNIGFWYSDINDLSPWIGFKMPSTYKVAVIEVDDRKDINFDRFKDVEVTVGTSPNVNDPEVKSCGTQSFPTIIPYPPTNYNWCTKGIRAVKRLF